MAYMSKMWPYSKSVDMVMRKRSMFNPKMLGDASEEENHKAMIALNADTSYMPLSSLVKPSWAHLAKQFLDTGLHSQSGSPLSPKSRGYVYDFIMKYMEPGAFKFPVNKILRDCGIGQSSWTNIQHMWPEMWSFINLVIRETVVTEAVGRVASATVEAAVNGEHQDRRLFFELFQGFKQKDNSGLTGTIVFVNDAVVRPSEDGTVTIDGRRSPESSAPGTPAKEANIVLDLEVGLTESSDSPESCNSSKAIPDTKKPAPPDGGAGEVD